MGYLIKKLPYVKRTWKVQFETWSPSRKIKDIPLNDYVQHGFLPSMSYEEAVAKKDQLNALAEERRHAHKKTEILSRLQDEERSHIAFLNELDVREFESRVLFSRDHADTFSKNKTESHWRKAKRLLCEIRLEPKDWWKNKTRFYDYFSQNKMSPSYVQKILRICNQWGDYLADKYQFYFKEIPLPTGREKERITDKYFEKKPSGMKSTVLFPSDLEAAKDKIPAPYYAWLYLSVWFGLRPKEIDSIAAGKHFETTTINGVQVLKIYQTKLMSVPREERWKHIPCYEPEQIAGLALLSESIKRPGRKMLRNHFKAGTKLYAGRKGFQDLMLSRGHSLEDISTWMGHMSIDRTWRDYKNRLAITVKPKKPSA